jgi:phosphate transport system protein
MAVNICERVLELNQEPQLKPYIDLPVMTDIAQNMVREALEAFLNEDVKLALKVTRDDEKVDQYLDQISRELLTYMAQDPKTITRASRILFIAKYLERMADHAVNTAELVLFMMEGKIIRHIKPAPEE